MKKSLIFKILYLFLGLVVMAGASVFATNTFLANQVTYGNTNVETALNNLFIQNNKQNYSTDEKVVGKWIDGKNIYRKVFPYSSEINRLSSTNTGITLNNIDSIINGWFVQSGRGLHMPAEFYMKNTTQLYYYSMDNAGRSEKQPIHIVLEYTKTTDLPTNN